MATNNTRTGCFYRLIYLLRCISLAVHSRAERCYLKSVPLIFFFTLRPLSAHLSTDKRKQSLSLTRKGDEIRFPFVTFCIQPASDDFITEREKISRKGCPTSLTFPFFFLSLRLGWNVIRINIRTRFLLRRITWILDKNVRNSYRYSTFPRTIQFFLNSLPAILLLISSLQIFIGWIFGSEVEIEIGEICRLFIKKTVFIKNRQRSVR